MLDNLQTAISYCQQIIENSKREIFTGMRFFGLSLGYLRFEPSNGIRGDVTRFATDGIVFYYESGYLLKRFSNDESVTRGIVHSLLHCIFRHVTRSQYRVNPYVWDVACDVSVGYILDGFDCPFLRDGKENERKTLYDKFFKKIKVLTAEKLYDIFLDENGDGLVRIEKAFFDDEHVLWERFDDKNQSENQSVRLNVFKTSSDIDDSWDETAKRTLVDLTGFGSGVYNTDRLEKTLKAVCEKKYDFKSFISKFLRIKEVNVQSEDEFDYIYYCYGLTEYGNVPLIENLEYRDDKSVTEIVIVIDTSMSTQCGLVDKFLNNVYAVVDETFGKTFTLRILQCDDEVRSEVTVKNDVEFKSYMNDFKMIGGGGTDFRRAFKYVDEKTATGEYGRIQGLIYFTDGLGIYPKLKPKYKTAFVLVEDVKDAKVPVWADRLVLGED